MKHKRGIKRKKRVQDYGEVYTPKHNGRYAIDWRGLSYRMAGAFQAIDKFKQKHPEDIMYEYDRIRNVSD